MMQNYLAVLLAAFFLPGELAAGSGTSGVDLDFDLVFSLPVVELVNVSGKARAGIGSRHACNPTNPEFVRTVPNAFLFGPRAHSLASNSPDNALSDRVSDL